MKNILMSILLVVACVCVSCEPTEITGVIDKVNLSKSDKEKLDAIFQHVGATAGLLAMYKLAVLGIPTSTPT